MTVMADRVIYILITYGVAFCVREVRDVVW